ncbi:MAG: hypothetical protein KKD17_02720 [Nanoarchaeota archaeon]|nr:hypothetical protein [Nanoarchaeota archaeon]
MLKRKAIIFSLDAIFAVVVAGLMILACFLHLSQTTTNIHQNQDIYKISLDSLTILEKDRTLKTAVETNSAATIQSFLDALPEQFCGNITVRTSAAVLVLSAQKAGCTEKNESTSAVRAFTAGNSAVYYAGMKAWYK